MKTPAFWSNPHSWQAKLLAPLGHIYGSITLRRMNKSGVKLNIPVICIGNPTVGGQGKTPTAIAIAEILIKQGRKPIFLSRGYGSLNKGVTPVQPHHTAKDVGDEPLLLAKIAPVIVAKDRVLAAKMALTLNPDCLILDDGFQNPSLHKDLSILVMNGDEKLQNQRIFPAGTLRAPLQAQIEMADMTLIIGGNEARLIAEPLEIEGEVIAFCGLGQPQKFRKTLDDLKIKIKEFCIFPDHHFYSDADAKSLLSKGLPLVTTAKDAVKLTGTPRLEALAKASKIVHIKLKFSNETVILSLLDKIF